MNSNRSYPIDPLLAAKLRSLENLDARIADLAPKLERMKINRRNLEQEIATIRASTAPIRRLPTEILIDIFKELLHRAKAYCEWPEPTRQIADLLLVCKSWHHLVFNSPILWTRIYVKLAKDVIKGASLVRELKYFQTFMERSKELPVHVSIDLHHLHSGQAYIEAQLKSSLLSIIYEGKFYENEGALVDALFDWCPGLPWQHCPIVDPYEQLCCRFLRSIAGRNGSYMRRWNSLHLELPYGDEFANNMLKSLDFEAPLLRNLYLHSADDLGTAWESHPLRTSSTLDQISLDGNFMLTSLPQSYGAQRLELLAIESIHGINCLNSFTNLRYLRLQVYLPNPDWIAQPIKLPHLQHLRVGGFVPRDLLQAFEITRLSHLSIYCTGQGQLGEVPYPTVNLFQAVDFVSITIICPNYYDRRSHVASMAAGLFKQLSSTTTIGVEVFSLTGVSSLIAKCREKGQLPALRSLVKVNDKGEIIDGTEYATFSVPSTK